MVIYHHSTVITEVILLNNTEWEYDHEMAVNYCGKKFYNNGPWTQYYKTIIYCQSTVKPSFCVKKQNYHGNNLGMEVNTQIL